MDVVKHPVFKYYHDFQSVAFSRVDLTSGQNATATVTLENRFIATKLVASVFSITAGAPPIMFELKSAPITTLLRYHTSALDNTPIPIGAAWGTGRHPAMLPIPWAVEKGTAISVECSAILSLSGVIASNSMRVFLSMIGYYPSDEEFEAIRNFNNARFVRPYQTFTLAPAGAKVVIDPAEANRIWNTNFPLDFAATRATGVAINVTIGDEINGLPPALEDPALTIQMISKSTLYNTAFEAFRTQFGDGDFPMPLRPPAIYKQGDVLQATLNNLGGRFLKVFPAFLGYVPTDSTMRLADIERGRSQPELRAPLNATTK